MNRAIIILSIPILLLVGGFIFYQSNTRSAPSNVTTVAPTEKPTTDSEQPTKTTSLENADFKMYNGQYVTYKYPGSWNPKKEESFGGGILESVNLGIPGVTSDQMLGFSSIDAANSRPNDIVSEESITISGSDEYLWRRGRFYIYSPKLVAFDHLELLEHPFITERLTNYRDIPHLNQNVAGRKLFDQLIESHEDILFLRLRAFVSDIIFDFENRSNRLEIKSYKHLAENYVDCLIDHRVFSFAWAEHIDENGQKKMVYANWIYSRLENFLQKLGLFQKNGLKKFYPMIMNLIFSGADPYHDLLRIGIKKKKGSYVQEVNNFLNAKILLLQRQGLLGETESKIIIYLAHFFIQFFKKLEGIDYFSYFPTLDYSRPDPIIGMFSGLYRKHQNLETLDLLLKGIPSNSKLTPLPTSLFSFSKN
jgi:hypothetical protein